MRKILIIDDDPELILTLAATLRRDGHQVIEATGGAEALRLVSSESPDLVLTDILMPEGDGIEVAMALRERHPNIPVIVMSGYSAFSGLYLHTAQKLGAVHILTKPFSGEQLRGLVNACFALRENREL